MSLVYEGEVKKSVDWKTKKEKLLAHLKELNYLQMVWLHRIGTYAAIKWPYDSQTQFLELGVKDLKGMLFFEKIHEVTQQLLDDINEM